MAHYFLTSYRILTNIYQNGAYSQLAVHAEIEKEQPENQSLITKIVYGVIENDIYLDFVIMQNIQKKPKPGIMIILKIATYMTKFLQSVPQYAIGDCAVQCARWIGKSALCGFINATYKNIVTKKIELPTDPLMAMSIQFSYPLWFVRRSVKQYGMTLAKQILSHCGEGKTTIRRTAMSRTVQEFEENLKKYGIAFEKTPVSDMYYVSHSTMMRSKFPQNQYVTQGMSSVLTCRAMHVDTQARILDVCAAPGGKSVLLSEIAHLGFVTACDLHEHRVELIKKYAARLNRKNVTCVQQDATVMRTDWLQQFDAVLVDAPCSGFGAVADRPDIKMQRKENDILELSKTQAQIIKTAAAYVKKGGILMYATCTILAEENQAIVQNFLESNRDFCLRPIELEIKPHIYYDTMVQLLPPLEHMQGFFMAKMQRV